MLERNDPTCKRNRELWSLLFSWRQTNLVSRPYFFIHHSHFNAKFAGRASVHAVLWVDRITRPHGASTDEGLSLGRGKYELWGTVVRDEGLGMIQIIFHVPADTRHNVTLDFPLKIETWKIMLLKTLASFRIVK